MDEEKITDLATEVILLCRQQGLRIATAESLTGGLLCGALTAVPGASVAVMGGVVAYSTDRKAAVLGVPAELLEERGAVDGDVVRAMAVGVQTVMAADVALATTGVAGPEPQDGKPVGTVFVAVIGPAFERVEELSLDGDRSQIRERTMESVLRLCRDELRQAPESVSQHKEI